MDAAQDLFFAQQALSTLFSVANKLQIQGDKYLQDLTIRQMLAIPAIFHAPEGKATINHIARTLGTTKQSAKQIVEAMEKKGYLSTAPSKRDKRAVDVSITPEGERVFSACSERTDEFMADIFQDFTTEDLANLCTLLEKLYQFDGAKQASIQEHINDRANKNDDVLEYHQNYIKRRTRNRE
ncbi:MAG: MarR family transcriptional regulator [Campylobacteraceae bacterium]|jgi:DNA-binding MarR family transcriptional regulator|nr:MarR family transcriptional regulator [Campylobacteraceae bacterium]